MSPLSTEVTMMPKAADRPRSNINGTGNGGMVALVAVAGSRTCLGGHTLSLSPLSASTVYSHLGKCTPVQHACSRLHDAGPQHACMCSGTMAGLWKQRVPRSIRRAAHAHVQSRCLLTCAVY